MKGKLIIFDFLRTIFDPDKESFLENAICVLENLRSENTLVLYTSQEGDKNREEKLTKLQMEIFFDEICLVETKNKRTIRSIAQRHGKTKKNVIVVGDRVRSEIKIGKQNGFETIWLRKGKYQDELPSEKDEQPDYMIDDLKDLLKLNI